MQLPFTGLYNEQSYLLRIANGDEDAFRIIFDYYRPVIFKSAYRLTNNISVSEDILQDTFLNVWLKRKMLPEITNFSGWLYTVYVNLMLNDIKKMSRKKVNESILQRNLVEQINLPDYQVERKEIEYIIKVAVENLPEKQRNTYRLIREEGLSRQQAAELMHVAPETVKSNLDRAVKYIRAFCQKELLVDLLLAFTLLIPNFY